MSKGQEDTIDVSNTCAQQKRSREWAGQQSRRRCRKNRRRHLNVEQRTSLVGLVEDVVHVHRKHDIYISCRCVLGLPDISDSFLEVDQV